MMIKRPLLFAVALSCATAVAAAAQRPAVPGGRGGGTGTAAARDTDGVPAVEKVSTTKHTVTIDGKTVAYTANTGTMVVRDENGKPNGTVFYISYTKDQEDAARRPITSPRTAASRRSPMSCRCRALRL